ncbi:hypothetical protein GGQ61_001325 [Phenylobacterium haematophilum]|uniref:DUF2274 domain-containing protein n=1 Tax=Phenylobacterium haematophilum TaxID=98513 RepID=A0A839ZX14_9CAUL|nr:DUF2274 domain-containing protein [Phenylobacterium haematophilum]MBB3890608.1 hypothetical protein [Phenylobacterium haematophilum]
MTALKLGAIAEERPVRLTIELPAAVFRDLTAYGEVLARETGEAKPIEPARLVAPMLSRFMATDRGFGKLRRSSGSQGG